MTRKIEGGLVLEREKPQQCDLCGKMAELRPYGPNGECVCFACGMKDEDAAQRAFMRALGFSEVRILDELGPRRAPPTTGPATRSDAP